MKYIEEKSERVKNGKIENKILELSSELYSDVYGLTSNFLGKYYK